MANNRTVIIVGIIIIISLVTVIGFFMQLPQDNDFEEIIDFPEDNEDCVSSNISSNIGLGNYSARQCYSVFY